VTNTNGLNSPTYTPTHPGLALGYIVNPTAASFVSGASFAVKWDPLGRAGAGPPWSVQIIIQGCNWSGCDAQCPMVDWLVEPSSTSWSKH